MVVGFFLIILFWLLASVAIIILPIVAITMHDRKKLQPRILADPLPPPPVRRPRREAKAAGPVMLRKWSIEHRREVARDKHAWDREFAQAQEEARLKAAGWAWPAGPGVYK